MRDKIEKKPLLGDAMIVERNNIKECIRENIKNCVEKRHAKNTDIIFSNAVHDFSVAMEKKRTSVLVESTNELLDSPRFKNKKYIAGYWIRLNVYSFSYTYLICDILTASAIWLLDRISESGRLSEACQLIPKDEESIHDFMSPHISDSKYDKKLIAGIESVIFNRNKDIAPLEDDGFGFKRIITSDLAAKGKDKADVKSKRDFEKLISLVPQEAVDTAVKNFKTCFDAWCDRFFSNVESHHNIYLEKLDKVNSIHKKHNKLADQFNSHYKEFITLNSDIRQFVNPEPKHRKKAPHVNAFLNKPEPALTSDPALNITSGFMDQLSTRAEYSQKTNDYSNELEKICDDLQKLHNDDLHAMLEHNHSLTDAIATLMPIVNRHHLTMPGVKSAMSNDTYYDQLMSEINCYCDLPISDPYELCFALLYLVESGSNIPWLYGACVSTMNEVVDHLPWGIKKYKQENKEDKDAPELELPDLYKRSYIHKDDYECNARSLSQIIYESSGCLMPRDFRNYAAEIEDIKKNYSLDKNEEDAVVYSLLALRRERITCDDFEEQPENWFEQKKEYEKEIQQLKASLYQAEKSVKETEKKLAEQAAASENEKRELADLRELIYINDTNSNEDADDSIDESEFPYEVRYNTVIFSGNDRYLNTMKTMFKGQIRFINANSMFDKSIIKNADIIWIHTYSITHSSYYRIISADKNGNIPFRYFRYPGPKKCAVQVAENEKSMS